MSIIIGVASFIIYMAIGFHAIAGLVGIFPAIGFGIIVTAVVMAMVS